MTSRERFEACSLTLGRLIDFSFSRHDNGVYKMRDTHIAWLIWQAAERSTLEQAIVEVAAETYPLTRSEIVDKLKELLK